MTSPSSILKPGTPCWIVRDGFAPENNGKIVEVERFLGAGEVFVGSKAGIIDGQKTFSEVYLCRARSKIVGVDSQTGVRAVTMPGALIRFVRQNLKPMYDGDLDVGEQIDDIISSAEDALRTRAALARR